MGVPVATLKEWMTEAEFHAHRVQMATDPDPDEKTRHLMMVAVRLLQCLANTWGAKVRLEDRHLDPWGEDAKAAEKRVAAFALAEFGLTLDEIKG